MFNLKNLKNKRKFCIVKINVYLIRNNKFY